MRIQYRSVFFNVICLCMMSYQSVDVTEKSLHTSYDNQNLIAPEISHDKKIVCYLGSWSLDSMRMNVEFDIDPNLCTHIIYAFASFNENGVMIDEKFGKLMKLFHLLLNYKMYNTLLDTLQYL